MVNWIIWFIGFIFAAPFRIFAKIILFIESATYNPNDPLYLALKEYNEKTPTPAKGPFQVQMERMNEWSYSVLRQYER